MTTEYACYSVPQQGAEVVTGQSGTVIKVLMLLVTCWSNARVQLLSDPLGDDERPLLPWLHVGGGYPLLVPLGRRFGVAADRGKTVGVNTEYQSTASQLSILICFERVT